MRRSLSILGLIIGLMGVSVVPIQANDGSDDGDDSRNESNENHSGDRDDDDDGDGDNNFRRRVWLSDRNEVPAGDPDGSGWAEVGLRPQAGPSATGSRCGNWMR